ncbi:hypothetical protein AB8U03_05505 [Clostridium sp. Mt-5]|uniref:Uncharacterized protein n=1 Tax=Clostridium moutaii TaxID=3240932 RepID=A0ABV4BPH3_9CLOT
MELKRIYGITHGGSRRQIVSLKPQSDIAKQLGIDVKTMQRLKKLQTLSPELQQLIEDGSVKYTTALNVWTKLSPDEQHKFFNQNFYIPEVYHFKVSIFIL